MSESRHRNCIHRPAETAGIPIEVADWFRTQLRWERWIDEHREPPRPRSV